MPMDTQISHPQNVMKTKYIAVSTVPHADISHLGRLQLHEEYPKHERGSRLAGPAEGSQNTALVSQQHLSIFWRWFNTTANTLYGFVLSTSLKQGNCFDAETFWITFTVLLNRLYPVSRRRLKDINPTQPPVGSQSHSLQVFILHAWCCLQCGYVVCDYFEGEILNSILGTDLSDQKPSSMHLFIHSFTYFHT